MIIIHAVLGANYGGVGSVLRLLINEQIKEHKIHIICPDTYDNKAAFKELEGVEIHYVKNYKIKGETLLFGLPIKKIYKRISKDNPGEKTIVHAHTPASLGLFRNITKMHAVLTLHGIGRLNSKISGFLNNMIVKKANHSGVKLFAVCKHTADYFCKTANIKHIDVIYNGVDSFSRTVNHDRFTILFAAGLLDELKGWIFVKEAFEIIRKRGYDIKMKVAGNSPNELKDDLEVMKEKYGDSFEYLGYVKDIGKNLMQYVDLLIMPSRIEGFPMIILEALSSGMPVLATRVGGIPEMLSDGENGFFIQRDSKDIAEKIISIYEDEKLYEQLKESAYNSYTNKFKSEKMTNAYIKAYKEY